MPLYTFLCPICKKEEDKLAKWEDILFCKKCETEMVRKITAPSLSFKGEGFYITDYKRSRHDKNRKD
jgi:putative FmdB family regulatory protein